jgi:hypothetical protein
VPRIANVFTGVADIFAGIAAIFTPVHAVFNAIPPLVTPRRSESRGRGQQRHE